MLALCVDAKPDDPASVAKATRILAETGFPFDSGYASDETLDLLHLAHNNAFLRPSQLPVPTTLIVAPESRIATVVRGDIDPAELIPALLAVNGSEAEWQRFASPAGGMGTWLHGTDTIYYVGIAKGLVRARPVD